MPIIIGGGKFSVSSANGENESAKRETGCANQAEKGKQTLKLVSYTTASALLLFAGASLCKPLDTDGDGLWFCFPNPSVGPSLIQKTNLQVPVLWKLLQTAGGSAETETADVRQRAIQRACRTCQRHSFRG